VLVPVLVLVLVKAPLLVLLLLLLLLLLRATLLALSLPGDWVSHMLLLIGQTHGNQQEAQG
jgi:hypothetical protein